MRPATACSFCAKRTFEGCNQLACLRSDSRNRLKMRGLMGAGSGRHIPCNTFFASIVGAKNTNHHSYESCHHFTCFTHVGAAASRRLNGDTGCVIECRFACDSGRGERSQARHLGRSCRRHGASGPVAIPEVQGDVWEKELNQAATVVPALVDYSRT